MVICDADHPDIEEFINWKVIEEQKVASIVAGSKMHERCLNDIFAAIGGWDGAVDDAYDPKVNDGLKEAVKAAKKQAIPETYVKRVLDYAKQGYSSIEFPTYNTDWDSEAYSSVSGQNSNNSIRVTDAFLKAVKDDADWELIRRTDGKIAKTIKARRSVGTGGSRRMGLRRSRHPISRHGQCVAHLPGRRSNSRLKPLF